MPNADFKNLPEWALVLLLVVTAIIGWYVLGPCMALFINGTYPCR